MNDTEKIRLLEARLQILTVNSKDNQGVCRRIRREIRNLKKNQEGECQTAMKFEADSEALPGCL